MADSPDKPATPEGGKVVIKKYANRRLYNTASSSYVTLEHLSEMVKKNIDFVVYDAKTNEDITRSVLTQIIFEEESQGQSLLPIQFLRQLIGFYGDSMQAFLPSYLELSLDSFSRQQEQMRKQFAAGKIPGLPVGGNLQDQVRQNMQMFERAMKIFTPFGFPGVPSAPASTPSAEPEAKPAPEGDTALDDLKQQLAAMQAQIEKLANKP